MIVSSFTTAGAVLAITGAYVFIVHLAWRISWTEAIARTGLTLGAATWWLISLAVLPLWLGYAWLSYGWMPIAAEDTGSSYHAILGQGLNATTTTAAIAYGVISAGFGEELLFRGLIGGALARRLGAWQANTVQALVFLAPHLLILLVKPAAWFLLPGVFVLALLTGWLRIRSKSIGPGLILHGVGNTLVGLLAAVGG